MAGVVALGDIHLHFARQVWHLATSTFTARGRRGAYGTGLALVARLGAAWAGVALGDIHLHFAYQVWHFTTSTFTLRGRRGTPATSTFVLRGRPPSFCVAGIRILFAWQAWHLRHWAGSGGAFGRRLGANAAALWVAGVALGDIHLRFAWQAWHLVTSTFVLRGTCAHQPPFGVAGVALGDIHLRGRHGTWSHPQVKLRGSCGTYSRRPTFCMSYFCASDVCACCSHVWPCFSCIQCLAVSATSSLGYLCMVWSPWLNVGRDLVYI